MEVKQVHTAKLWNLIFPIKRLKQIQPYPYSSSLRLLFCCDHFGSIIKLYSEAAERMTDRQTDRHTHTHTHRVNCLKEIPL